MKVGGEVEVDREEEEEEDTWVMGEEVWKWEVEEEAMGGGDGWDC